MEPQIARLGLALAIGLLVGLERGWRERDAPAHSRTAGIRTFGVFGLLGGIFAVLSKALESQAVFIAGFICLAAIFSWYKLREAIHDKDYSVTTVVAGLGVFGLGALAVAGDYRVAAAGGAALAGILASRDVLHRLLRNLTWIELRSALVLAVMTGVVLPLLPNRPIDPWGGFNPFEVWLFTVLVAAISYLGYVTVRLFGDKRGLLMSTLAGALVSSTAVAVALARTAGGGSQTVPLAGAASLAAMVSVLRVCFVIVLLQPSVLPVVAAPALSGALCFGAFGLIALFGRTGDGAYAAEARNPFDLPPLLMFATFLAIVSTIGAAVSDIYGGRGLLATTALSGILDVDIATLTALRLIDQSASVDLVGNAILVALLANAFGRLLLVAVAGPARFWLPYAAATFMALGAGLATFVVLSS